MVLSIIMVLYWMLLVTLGGFLVGRFLITRNKGFLVLSLALAVWPLLFTPLSSLLFSRLDSASSGEEVGFPFTLVTDGRATAGEAIAFISYAGNAVRVALVIWGLVLITRVSPLSASERATEGVAS